MACAKCHRKLSYFYKFFISLREIFHVSPIIVLGFANAKPFGMGKKEEGRGGMKNEP